MLKIRLSRAWKRNMPFFRLVLTESTAPSKSWYKKVLWFFNPISKEFKIKDPETMKKYISHWAQLSDRVKKLMEINKVSL